jgi:hypothetical protein
MRYRGIEVSENAKLRKVDGTFNKVVKEGLDKMVDRMEEEGHKVVGEYKGNLTEIMIDFGCGHEPSLLTPKSYKKGYGCKRCSGRSAEQSEEKLKSLAKENGHEILGAYEGSHKKILIDFKCGHKPHLIQPYKYKDGRGCPKCADENRIGNIRQRQRAIEGLKKLIVENGHELLSEYVDNSTKVLIDFKCGHSPNWTRPYSYKQGHGCPSCGESKGERVIREYLEDQGIVFVAQYKFPSLDRRAVHRYDFMLPMDNLIVEVHGKQHYEFHKHFHRNEEAFDERRRVDKMKREFAESLGYRYFEISYREGNPQTTLSRFKEEYLGIIKGVS